MGGGFNLQQSSRKATALRGKPRKPEQPISGCYRQKLNLAPTNQLRGVEGP